MDNVALSGGALYFGDTSASGGINTFYLTNNTIYRNHATYSTTTNMGGESTGMPLVVFHFTQIQGKIR